MQAIGVNTVVRPDRGVPRSLGKDANSSVAKGGKAAVASGKVVPLTWREGGGGERVAER